MFNKHDIIFSDGIGVCKVTDIVNLSVNKKTPIQYYLLTSVFDKNKTSYIPVGEHQVILRKLLTKEEAIGKKKCEKIPLHEQKEIEYVLGNEEKEGNMDGRE